MKKGLKITLIVVVTLALAGGIVAITSTIRKRKKDKEQKEKEEQEKEELEAINQNIESQQTIKDDRVVPVRNLDKNINNAFKDIKGVTLYPANKSSDPIQGHQYADGFANIRTSPEVNNAWTTWYDFRDNLLGRVSSGSKIGTIVSEQYDNMTPKMRWFRVKLDKKIDGKEYGWVRADVVTFRPFNKKTKSSFDGSFVEKYDTSYQLGADVFPHSNWMIGYGTYGDDVSSDFDGSWDIEI
jgi:hypothetical protein